MSLAKLETFEEKLQQLLDRVPDTLDKREGSIIYDALAPIAMQLWIEESKFRQILEQAFAVKAEGQYLDIIAQDHGLTRSPARASKVRLDFQGTPLKKIPKDTTVGIPNSDLSFTTDEEVFLQPVSLDPANPSIVTGVASVVATCKTPGDEGNVPIGVITLLFDPNPDIISVTNPERARFGADEESDESLRNRILYQKRNSEHGGTESDYIRWALAITGVTYAKALDKPRGIGTVDVIIGGNESQMDELVIQTQAILDKKKPIGLDLKVRKLTHQKVKIQVDVSGLDVFKATKAILAYTETIEVGGTLYLSKIVSALVNAGAHDAVVIQPKKNVSLDYDSAIDPEVVIQ